LRGTRSESITVAAGSSTATQSISNFTGGQWLNFQVNATAGESLTIANIAGSNAVIRAIMFEPVPEPSVLVGLMGIGLLGLVWRKRK